MICPVCQTPPCGREGHPCTAERSPVDEDVARRLWEITTDFGMGGGPYAWDDLREGARERFRQGVRLLQGEIQ